MSEYGNIELSPYNPLRPADWRWRRAIGITEGKIKDDRRLSDKGVRRAVRIAERTRRELTHDEEVLFVLKQPDLYWAYRIYAEMNPGTKAELEARVLADDTVENTARRARVPADVIKTYEEIFFDARQFLDNKGYVLNVIIGEALHRGLNEKQYSMLWKYYGYVYGPLMLDSLVERAIAPFRPQSIMQVGTAWRDDGFNSILQKQALAARLVPLNQVTQVEVLQVYSKFVEIAKSVEGGGGVSEGAPNYDENIMAVLKCLNLEVGQDAKPQIDLPLLRQYDSGSAELTTRQMLQASQGIIPTGVVEGLTYPERSTNVSIEHGSSPAAG